MATACVCDGNGSTIATDTPATGPYGRQYCDDLRPLAEKYLQEANDLHTALAEAYKADLATLREQYRDKLQNLPDTPDVG